MKEATGELSMTVITIVAIVAIAGFVTVWLWPTVRGWIEGQWGNLSGNTVGYVETINESYNM